jgi:hypothetical protein
MSPPRRITPDTLRAAPLDQLAPAERQFVGHLLYIASKRPWLESELRRAADLEVKAWAIKDGTWIFTMADIRARHPRQ